MHHLWGEGVCRSSHRKAWFSLLEGLDWPTPLCLPSVFSWVGPRQFPSACGSCRIPALTAPLSNSSHTSLLGETNLLKSGSNSFLRKIRKLALTTFCGGWIKCKWRDKQLVMAQNGPSRFKRRDVLWEAISFCLPTSDTLPWVSGHEATQQITGSTLNQRFPCFTAAKLFHTANTKVMSLVPRFSRQDAHTSWGGQRDHGVFLQIPVCSSTVVFPDVFTQYERRTCLYQTDCFSLHAFLREGSNNMDISNEISGAFQIFNLTFGKDFSFVSDLVWWMCGKCQGCLNT